MISTVTDVADAYAAAAKAQPECRMRRRRRSADFTTVKTAYIRSA